MVCTIKKVWNQFERVYLQIRNVWVKNQYIQMSRDLMYDKTKTGHCCSSSFCNEGDEMEEMKTARRWEECHNGVDEKEAKTIWRHRWYCCCRRKACRQDDDVVTMDLCFFKFKIHKKEVICCSFLQLWKKEEKNIRREKEKKRLVILKIN